MATNINLNEGHFFVSVDGNRLRQHEGNTVYLENNKEFQMEIFNPTTSKVLAKIKINGNYISTSGLVLKPGQRVFLERYFDKAQKFKFETYSVDNSPETAGAIANNGVVEVEFFKEYIAPPVYIPPYNPWNNIYLTGTVYGSGASTFTTSNFGGNLTNTSSISSNYSNGDSYKNMNTSNVSPQSRSMSKSKLSKGTLSDDGATLDFMAMDFERSITPTPEKKETGRVEAGSHSNQSFVTDYATYNSFVSSRVTWKILPLSQKPIEVSDLKTYCTSCGLKRKKISWNYCPQCSTKFE